LTHVIALLVCLVIPIISYFDMKRIKSSKDPQAKERMYVIICMWYWILTTIILFLAPFKELWSPRVTIEFNIWIVLTAIGFGILWLLSIILPLILMSLKPSFSKKVSDNMGDMSFIHPVTPKEIKLFVLLTFTVGFAEEIIFRAYLFQYVYSFGFTALVSFLIVTVIFGAVHYIQGVEGVLQAGFFGFTMGVLYFATGSLLLPIILHILSDLKIVYLSKLVNRS